LTWAGQRIDVFLQEALTFTNSSSVARYSRENRLERRPGGKDYGGAGTNIYRCKDGRYVHFTTNMPHMWREFAQNWMTDKSLAGPEWENPRYRDAHSTEVSKAFADLSAKFPLSSLPTRRSGVILPLRRSTPWDSSLTVNRFARANGFKRSSIPSSAATPRRDFLCGFH
jgi:crotonobetainyl-CoA:carnitine CoA-transferase CaiB-like acyl-CoA transferase